MLRKLSSAHLDLTKRISSTFSLKRKKTFKKNQKKKLRQR
jgi:hypothetical protein